ncbi:uncharacterized protein [Gossypium hirsutum]|uniref:Retrotransposon gag domain-containing protein n=1 Tax=Gossypium hirsutum TaxID=3635 RepID=A0A1U8IM31_GOSHI|nr:uncharacterized protein LOC107898203 [Gossypium hirsutum]
MSLLRDEAYQWWLTVRKGTQVDRLTWDFFNSAFQGKYVGTNYGDARRKEFLSLIQGNTTVAEYEAEFLRLSRYARGIVATEYERCRERDFAALVEKEKITKDVKRSECQNHENDSGYKRDFKPSSFSGRPGKKAKCGSVEHQVKNCPQRPVQMQAAGQDFAQPARSRQQPPRGRGQVKGENGVGLGRGTLGRGVGNSEARQPALVYAAHRREDGDAPDVITGTFLIYNVPYTTLIDIGSTHSYIACTVSGTLGIMCESTVNEMIVLSPLGQSVRVDKLFKDVPQEVQGVIFLADLMELLFGEFDLILGMDCLYWCTNSEVPSVGDIRTVKDFFDVFPDEFPGLPPSREVEFGIELLPRTAQCFNQRDIDVKLLEYIKELLKLNLLLLFLKSLRVGGFITGTDSSLFVFRNSASNDVILVLVKLEFQHLVELLLNLERQMAPFQLRQCWALLSFRSLMSTFNNVPSLDFSNSLCH